MGQVLEADSEGEVSLDDVLGDFGVAFLQAGHLPGKVLDGPGLSVSVVGLVDVGEVAGARMGKPIALTATRPPLSDGSVNDEVFWIVAL